MSDWISLELRNFVRQRARGRCEYCQLHNADVRHFGNARSNAL